MDLSITHRAAVERSLTHYNKVKRQKRVTRGNTDVLTAQGAAAQGAAAQGAAAQRVELDDGVAHPGLFVPLLAPADNDIGGDPKKILIGVIPVAETLRAVAGAITPPPSKRKALLPNL